VILADCCRTEDLPRVRAVLQNDTGKAREAALRLIALRGGWEALADILYCLLQDDTELAAQSRMWLRRWLARSTSLWQKPSSESLQRSREYIREFQRRKVTPLGEGSYDWQVLQFTLAQAEKLL
jgi:hypothetical protein